jgi:type I restriction enzyme S subunit
MGEVCMIPPNLECCLGQRQVLLRPNPEVIDGRFLLFALQSPQVQHEIGWSEGTGSTVSNVRIPVLKTLRIPTPALQTQRAIGSTLGALDDRIDLLRQTNATLESIAQALFKSWFIDFDPVRAKADGREPEGMDAATAALFPAEFEESALGLIPQGWGVEPIGDLVEAVGGSTPDTKNSTYWEPAIHCWTSPKDLSGATAPVLLDTERKVSPAGLAKISSGLLPSGSLLMSSRAPIGYLTLTQVPVAINQGYIAMLPGGRLPPLYLYFWCKANMEGIKGRANGSTFMEISKKAFRPIPALLPQQPLIDAFVAVADALFERLVANEKQARALVELRDAMLPRLISGRLRLPEAEAAIEAVA